jgi:hypothetical protein
MLGGSATRATGLLLQVSRIAPAIAVAGCLQSLNRAHSRTLWFRASNGGGPERCLNSAAMFWLTSWSRVPSR